MSTSLNINAPATLTVLGGNAVLSSMANTPPGAIVVTDPASPGTLNVQIIAGNSGAALSASSLGGATVAANGNTLSLSGTALQVNTALASLEVNEPATLSRDVLTLTASDPLALAAQTNIMVDIVPQAGPAFAAPPRIVTIQANTLDSIAGMLLSDPIASGLAAMGLGTQETLTLDLSVASGILLLPGYTSASGIAASGLGTGTIALSLTANGIGALNTLLAGLAFVGPKITGGEHLYYALRQVSGPLPTALTYGNIFLNIIGTAGSGATLTAGSQTVLTTGGTLGGVPGGITTALAGATAPGGLAITPDSSLQLPYSALTLGGTSYDYGTLGAASLNLAGTLVVAGSATLGGPLALGTAGLLDFNGLLVAGNAETLNNQLEISLAAGGVLTGNGTLLAGNFSESGMIAGPGTIAALGGETLLLAAGSIGGGAALQVASGGAMVLGPLSPLYGIFNATPVTIDNSVTLNFVNSAGAGVTGGYAGTLGGAGGAFVINGPQAFSGSITGFAPGDQLIFPGLSNFSIYNITAGSFAVGGQDASGSTVSYEIHAAIPSGTALAAGVDAQGDPSVFLRPAAPTIVTAGVFAASAGVAQPLQGIALQLGTGTTQSLSLTLAAANGLLSNGSVPAAQITLTGANIAALNTELAGLTYTGTGLADTLTLTSASAALGGLADNIYITAAAPGVVNGLGGAAFSEGQTASFGLTGGVSLFSQPAAPGALLVDGSTDFTAPLQANGISGTALVVEDNATAIFDSSATVALGGDVTIGDANGAGTLGVLAQAFSASGNMTLGGNAATGSDAYVFGGLGLGGSLAIDAGGQFALAGSLNAAAAMVAAGGTFFAYGNASAQLGLLADAGNIILNGAARAAATSLDLSGALSLGGTASLGTTGSLNMSGTSTLQIGAGASLQAATIAQAQGVITDSGLLAATGSLGAAGTILLTGGTLDAASLTNTGTLAGYGVLNAASLTNNGVILAQGGALILGGTVNNAAHITVMASAALDVTGDFSGAVITFMGGDAMITLDDPARFSASVANMAATDAIDLVGVAPGLVNWSGGTLTIANSQSPLAATVALQIAAGEPAFSVLSDGAGGALITLGGTLPCFARGARLLTPHGYRAVEELKPGDPLITAAGARRPVRWIGRRTLDLGPSAARDGLPVLILPNAFGPGQPARPLRLSPSHCVYAGGVLIPAAQLVNGATILRERTAPAMTYYHVELDRHDILLAEGLPCESYFDDGNRGALYHETGRRSPARKPFAPVITRGARLAAVRARLHAIALGQGFSLTYWPSLRAVAAGYTAIPEISAARRGRLARFIFPVPVRAVTLLSAVSSPADTDPACEDRRELGVCLDLVAGMELGQGFYPRGAQDDGVWTGRAATLNLPRAAADFTLPLAAIAQSWVKPVDAKAAPA
ncbi:hypothetical protein GCM10010909_09640 [Acidocella aquatica]|uniref:Hedgehog/Intein (Hint) domain-containing protein n=1 Tax=Acidocella aquatica TaxID=1922313 RepID=A0ABQ6A836_9PROT|nr:Hint domain-containing protein [Acidocella aquatica]GLR66284.1 hypothetical protein GCM10010909_09640 [Acidocella aquatica]